MLLLGIVIGVVGVLLYQRRKQGIAIAYQKGYEKAKSEYEYVFNKTQKEA